MKLSLVWANTPTLVRHFELQLDRNAQQAFSVHSSNCRACVHPNTTTNVNNPITTRDSVGDDKGWSDKSTPHADNNSASNHSSSTNHQKDGRCRQLTDTRCGVQACTGW